MSTLNSKRTTWVGSTIAGIAEAVACGNASAIEVLDDHLEQIERHNDAINALVFVDVDGARAQALEIDRKRSIGMELGPLVGVPVSIKESFAVAGWKTTCGIEANAELTASFDAPAVSILRQADAIIVGKSNVPTSLSGYGCQNPIYGMTRNPWQLKHTPGGSSGGSAAAVSSGFSALDLASDLSGSIRIPASWCGVAGYRPSRGFVSKRAHLPWPLDYLLEPPESVAGFIARSAYDLDFVRKALVQLLSIGSPVDKTIGKKSTIVDREPLRIGVWLSSDSLRAGFTVVSAISHVSELLVARGLQVQPFKYAHDTAKMVQLAWRLTDSEISLGLNEQGWQNWNRDLFTTRSYLRDLNAAEQLRAELDDELALFDVVVCPATPIPAPIISELGLSNGMTDKDGDFFEWRSISEWSLITSIAQLPSVTIPIALSEENLPIGMQIFGCRGSDANVLRVGAYLESLIGPIGRPPGMF